MIGQRIIADFMSIDPRDSAELNKTFFYEDAHITKELNVLFEENKYKFTFKSESKETSYFASYQSLLRREDMFLFKAYLDYCYPVIMGWHAMKNPQIIQEDFEHDHRYNNW